MIILCFFAYLVFYNLLNVIERLLFKRSHCIFAFLAFLATIAVAYPETAEIKRLIENRSYVRSWTLITNDANNWDWMIAGAFYSLTTFLFFAWLREYSERGYSSGGIARMGSEFDFSTIVQLFFWAAVAVLVLFGGYKLFAGS